MDDDGQVGLNEKTQGVFKLTEKQRKFIGVLRKEVGEVKYQKIKVDVLGGFSYNSEKDGSDVIEALKKEAGGSFASMGSKGSVNPSNYKSKSENLFKGGVESQKARKSLDDRAVIIKGNKYILISDRIEYFNLKYPQGCINTEIVSDLNEDVLIIKANAYPDFKDLDRCFTGHARVNFKATTKTEPLEDCETSAIGRALAVAGIGHYGNVAGAESIFDLGEGKTK